MSLLLDHGHARALEYPIGMIWEEARLVTERLNSMEATRAALLRMAVSAVLSKEASDAFVRAVTSLSETA